MKETSQLTDHTNLNRHILFDVCNTLFDSNTTFDFLDFYFNQNKLRVKSIFLKLIVRKYSPVHLLLKILTILYSKDFYKIAGVFLLKGQNITTVENSAREFVRNVLSTKKIKSAFEILEKNISSTILLSSSIEPIIEIIAQENGIKNYYASPIDHSNGRYTGRIIADLTGIKETKVASLLNENCLVITDNKSDYELVKLAKEKIIVISHPHEKKFWNSLNPSYIYR